MDAQAIRPFNQAHAANRTGLGLGLVIARRAVAHDGGELRVQDLPGEGCIFTVDMPLAGPLLGPEAPIHPGGGVLDGG